MKPSLKQYLAEIAPYTDGYILNSVFLSQAERISMLFDNCCSNYIIEIPLGVKQQTFDFSLCVLRSEADPLVKYWSTGDLPTIIQNNSLWNKLFRFCSLWNEPSSSLYDNISNVWFEFDCPQLVNSVPSPSFFFSPVTLNKMFYREKIDTDERFRQNIQWLYDPVLSLLFGPYLNDKVKTNLSRCIEELPKYGAVFQIGVMMARDYNRLRVCTSVPVNGYIGYLERIGWTGDLGDLDDILKSAESVADCLLIDIDVGEDIASAAGIECSFNNKPGLEAKIKKLMAFLADRNLCVEEKADSILSWMDFRSPQHQPGCRSMTCEIRRTLSHIKLSLSPTGSLAAKAYLCFSGNSQ